MTQNTANSDLSSCSDRAPTAGQVRAQTERILASKHFRQAASLDRFLRHIVEKTLADVAHELKEYVIGVEVFQRGADFEPGVDAVVRVQASKLRKKLDGFYEEEGASDPVVIELPKGHYVARFKLRQDEIVAPAAPKSVLTLVAPPERMSAALPAPQTSAQRRWPAKLRVAAIFISGVLSLLVAQQLGGLSVRRGGAEARKVPDGIAPQPDPALHPLWEHFLKPGASNVLAFGTPQFFNARGVFFRDVRVNSTAELNASPVLMDIQKKLGKALRPAEVYTGVGEAQGVHLLSRFFFAHEQDVRVARNRLVSWEEAKNHNLIFLSSMRFHTMADELNHPSDFTLEAGVDGRLINKRPLPGEEPEYRLAPGADHALVTLWPGKLPDRRVLHLSGFTTWATMAAVEYVTKPEHLRQLNEQLTRCADRKGARVHAPYFQALLRVEVKDSQPVGVTYVTHHDLEIAGEHSQVARR